MKDNEDAIEPNVASGFGEPSLDADPIDDDLDSTLEKMLDEAEGIQEPQETEQPDEQEPQESSQEEQVEEPAQEEPVQDDQDQAESSEQKSDPEVEEYIHNLRAYLA